MLPSTNTVSLNARAYTRSGRCSNVVLALLFVSCVAVAQPPAVSPEHATLIEAAKAYVWPKEETLPVPSDGHYVVELDGDRIEVFRDRFGVPHIAAPTIPAAFRAHGYVTMEDRCLQVLRTRDLVMGRLAYFEGEAALGSDWDRRIHGYTVSELEAMLAALRPDLRRYLEEFAHGVNAYLVKFAPETPPLTIPELAACAVYFMGRVGDGGAEEHHIYKLVTLVRFLKGDTFVQQMLHDCLPNDVPNSPATDHSHRHLQAGTRENTAPRADFDAAALAQAYGQQAEARRAQDARGVFRGWGSQAWTVTKQRSATGNALFFASPMMGFSTPAQSAEVHLSAPGLDVAGISLVGFPGVAIGHNARVAWGVTSGFLVDQSDMFLEEINPENELQYRHNGAWKDMEVIDWPVVVKRQDGAYEVRPFQVHRTIHGPVVWRMPYNHRAFVKASAHNGLQVESLMAFLDFDFAASVHDFEPIVRRIATAQNFMAADVDGNIGYWLSGRIPVRHPDQDLRLPTPGMGDYDWRGVTVATDLAASVNPPEGWFGNFNNKPSVRVPGWWPEKAWGQPIFDILETHNPIDWATFTGINRENGEHHIAGPFFKDYLAGLLRNRAGNDAGVLDALKLIDDWPSKDLPNSAAALLLSEWAMDTIVELLTPDFGFLVERSMSRENLQLFGLLTFRVLVPEMAGFPLAGDYLHGRDKDALAFGCFEKALGRLLQQHGPDFAKWPYEPQKLSLGELGEIPNRNCGTFWMAVELSQPMRVFTTMVPGQSERHASPHFRDQYDLHMNWQMKEEEHPFAAQR